jgi:acetamidase/formamidase
MKRVELTFDLIDAAPLKTPRAKAADAWLTFGFDEDLNRAMLMALNGMLDLIQEQRTVDRQEALLLASLAVDLRITQIVNRAQGVHAVLPIDAIAGSG